jgi:LysM repeat protein
MAGVAAAFAFGNAPAAAPAAAIGSGHHSAATAAIPQAGASAEQLVSITRQSTTGLPVIRVDASRLAAIKPKGKHHRTMSAKYVVKSGDTLASIAAHLYASPDYWPVLYWANRSEIKYASEIAAGQVLAVPAKPAKIPGAPTAVAPAPAPATSTAPCAGNQRGRLRGEHLVGQHGPGRARADGERLHRQQRLVPVVRHRR